MNMPRIQQAMQFITSQETLEQRAAKLTYQFNKLTLDLQDLVFNKNFIERIILKRRIQQTMLASISFLRETRRYNSHLSNDARLALSKATEKLQFELEVAAQRKTTRKLALKIMEHNYQKRRFGFFK